jgi:hypothetical protein
LVSLSQLAASKTLRPLAADGDSPVRNQIQISSYVKDDETLDNCARHIFEGRSKMLLCSRKIRSSSAAVLACAEAWWMWPQESRQQCKQNIILSGKAFFAIEEEARQA